MKQKYTSRYNPAFLLFASLTLGGSAQTTSLSWDTVSGDGTVLTAASGTWNTTFTKWNNAGTNVIWTNSTNNLAIFSATDDLGTYAITVGTNLTAGFININNSGYTFSAASPTTLFNAGALTIASGKTATIGSNLTYSTSGAVTGGGTLNVGSGAIFTNANLASVTGNSIVNVMTGGVFSTTGTVSALLGGTLNGTMLVNGGSVNVGSSANTTSNLVLTNNTTGTSSGTLTLTTGTVTVNGTGGGLRYGGSGTSSAVNTGTVNLDGGTLTTGKVYNVAAAGTMTSTFNFNGGTLQVLTGSTGATTFMTGLTTANVKEGGAIIDTNGVATTISQALVHGGVAAIDGGLTKNGAGTLTLTGANTYNGGTFVNNGTLATSGAGTFGAGNVTVASGASLTAGNAASFADTASLTFSNNSLGLITLSAGTDTLANIFNAGSLTGTGGVVNTFIAAGTYSAGQLNAFFGGSVFTGAGSLQVSAIPEPATYAALAGGILLGFAVYRRRRSQG